jgi:hypothetical protein
MHDKKRQEYHLKTVEAPCLGDLDLLHETFDQVLVDNAVGCREEGR